MALLDLSPSNITKKYRGLLQGGRATRDRIIGTKLTPTQSSGHDHPAGQIKPRCRHAGNRTVALNVAQRIHRLQSQGRHGSQKGVRKHGDGQVLKECIICSGLASEDPKRILVLVGAAPANNDALSEACF